jgi:hypothetical protein
VFRVIGQNMIELQPGLEIISMLKHNAEHYFECFRDPLTLKSSY